MAEAGAEACRQLKPVLIVLELTPLTPIEIIKAHEIQKLPPPSPPWQGRGSRQDGASA